MSGLRLGRTVDDQFREFQVRRLFAVFPSIDGNSLDFTSTVNVQLETANIWVATLVGVSATLVIPIPARLRVGTGGHTHNVIIGVGLHLAIDGRAVDTT